MGQATFRRILCPIDFSVGSERALEHAMAWAAREGSSLELLHVLEPPDFTRGELWTLYLEFEKSLLRKVEDQMEASVRMARVRVPGATGRVIQGRRAAEILAHAGGSGADLVVIGTSGIGALRGILGSVADRMLRTSRSPVLLVPSQGRPVSAVPKHIVAATDFSAPSKAGVTRSIALGRELGASVEVVHAYELPRIADPGGHVAIGLRTAMTAEIHEEHPDLAEGRARAHEGPAAATIVSLADESKADLITIASSGRGLVSKWLLGSVTDRVVRMTDVPVLVWRPEPERPAIA